jgi:PKHD-type hydroxylase
MVTILSQPRFLSDQDIATIIEHRHKSRPVQSGPKNTLQSSLDSPAWNIIEDRLLNDKDVRYGYLPVSISEVFIAEYEIGMEYNWHYDSGFIRGKPRDLSFTIGIEDQYEGGELEIENFGTYRIARGEILIYPTTFMHRVKPITSGKRTAIIGWFESEFAETALRQVVGKFNLLQSQIRSRKTDKAIMTAQFIEQNLRRLYRRR